WKPPAHSPEENMVRQKCSGIRRSYLDNKPGFSNYENAIAQCSWANSLIEQRIIECYPELPLMRIVPSTGIEQTELGNSICRHLNLP
ncbi:hypothetical protein PPK18_26065, partial [Klebsiella pneumoniae]